MNNTEGNIAVHKWCNVPKIQRKHYEKMARIRRNEIAHDKANVRKEAIVVVESEE